MEHRGFCAAAELPFVIYNAILLLFSLAVDSVNASNCKCWHVKLLSAY